MTFWIFMMWVVGAYVAGWVSRIIFNKVVYEWPPLTEQELAERSARLDREIVEYYGGQEKFDEWCRNSGREVAG